LTSGNKVRTSLLFTALLLISIAVRAQAQTPPAYSKVGTTATRPCSANPVLTPGGKEKGSHKPKHPMPSAPAPACIEVKGEGMEIQEFLQNTAREQGWRIGENRASDDTWFFVRYLDPDELEKYAETKVLIEPIQFTSGKAAVTLRTTEIDEGYVRVQIIVQLQGEGKSSDKVLGQPGSAWTLNSKGVLEQELVTALQTRYKPLG
jgi:hypothetical protein